MINVIKGNVLQAKEDIIGHQVNCMGVMGSGVAKGIRNTFPEIFNKYKDECMLKRSLLLGTNQYIYVGDKIICNMFGQNKFGTDKQYTEIKELESCISNLYNYAKENRKSVALPHGIGCGRGGANWTEVHSIIQKYFNDEEVFLTLYLYN